jgi:hypothetical protein
VFLDVAYSLPEKGGPFWLIGVVDIFGVGANLQTAWIIRSLFGAISHNLFQSIPATVANKIINHELPRLPWSQTSSKLSLNPASQNSEKSIWKPAEAKS